MATFLRGSFFVLLLAISTSEVGGKALCYAGTIVDDRRPVYNPIGQFLEQFSELIIGSVDSGNNSLELKKIVK